MLLGVKNVKKQIKECVKYGTEFKTCMNWNFKKDIMKAEKDFQKF